MSSAVCRSGMYSSRSASPAPCDHLRYTGEGVGIERRQVGVGLLIALYLFGLVSWSTCHGSFLPSAHGAHHHSGSTGHSSLCQTACHGQERTGPVSALPPDAFFEVASLVGPYVLKPRLTCAHCTSHERAPPPAPVWTMRSTGLNHAAEGVVPGRASALIRGKEALVCLGSDVGWLRWWG